MITKEIEIGSKKVNIAYCYATEIAYKMLADEDISILMKDTQKAFAEDKMPDTKKVILLIIAAANAWYDYNKQDTPISDVNLMYESSPEELGKAFGQVLVARAEFYKVPTGEAEEKKEGEGGKN